MTYDGPKKESHCFHRSGKGRMMDYHGFWQGFLVLFGIVPFLVGALGGLLWAWRKGRRGRALIPSALFAGAIVSFGLLAGAVVVFRF